MGGLRPPQPLPLRGPCPIKRTPWSDWVNISPMKGSRFRCCSTKFFHVSRNLWTTFPYSATLINIQNVLIAFSLQWNPVDTVTNGPKKLAVLTGDHINEGFFYQENMYDRFARRPKKIGRNNEVNVLPWWL